MGLYRTEEKSIFDGILILTLLFSLQSALCSSTKSFLDKCSKQLLQKKYNLTFYLLRLDLPDKSLLIFFLQNVDLFLNLKSIKLKIGNFRRFAKGPPPLCHFAKSGHFRHYSKSCCFSDSRPFFKQAGFFAQYKSVIQQGGITFLQTLAV